MTTRAHAAVAAHAPAVTKPVTPAEKKPTRTGPRPVTKAASAPAAAKPDALTAAQRQAVKLLVQRVDERLVLDKVLALALEAGALTADENDVVARLQARSKARRW